jgi:hypothetical protein
VPLQPQLGVDRLGDVVVAAPVRRPFGVSELIHVMTAGFLGESRRDLVQRPGVVDQVTAAALGLDQADLLATRGARHDRDERHPDQLGEVRLGDRRRAAGRLDHRTARPDPAVAQGVQEERPGQPVLEAAGGMGRLVLQIQVHAPFLGQREPQQMGVGRTVGIGLNLADGLLQPGPVFGVAAVHVEGLHARIVAFARTPQILGICHTGSHVPELFVFVWLRMESQEVQHGPGPSVRRTPLSPDTGGVER